MINVFNTTQSTRSVFDGIREVRFEPGANLIDDATWTALLARPSVAALVAFRVLRERALPSADQDFNGGPLPDTSAELTEAAALRAIAVSRDADQLRGWRVADPRPAVRRAIDLRVAGLRLPSLA